MRYMALVGMICLAPELLMPTAVAQNALDDGGYTTWADSHPELFAIFGEPFTAAGRKHRKETFVPWPLDGFDIARVLSIQPVVVKGPGGELVANGAFQLVRSTDGGHTWTGIGVSPLEGIPVPQGMTNMSTRLNGCGVTNDGTLVVQISCQWNDGRKYEGLSDPSYHTDLYVRRSTDDGKTWSPPTRLNAGPHENAGGHQTRFFHLPGGRIGLSMGAWYQTETGEPIALSEMYERTYIWSSADDGRTWARSDRPICSHGAEPDILVLASGRILASVRYQRHKLPGDPPDLASPHLLRSDKPPYTKSKGVGKGLAARLSGVLHSDDGGKTWSQPRLLAGFDEQTGCLIQLSDDTVLFVFGHKTDGLGQRFMLSYDQGETWSKTVYQLHWLGQYASSVVLDDDTIITIIWKGKHRYIHALRWRAPSRQEVEKGGFWTPRIAEPLGVPAS